MINFENMATNVNNAERLRSYFLSHKQRENIINYIREILLPRDSGNCSCRQAAGMGQLCLAFTLLFSLDDQGSSAQQKNRPFGNAAERAVFSVPWTGVSYIHPYITEYFFVVLMYCIRMPRLA